MNAGACLNRVSRSIRTPPRYRVTPDNSHIVMQPNEQQTYEEQMAFFAAEWSRVQPIVQNYVLAIIRRPQDVDDVVQEVAVTVCKDLERFDRSKEFLPWVLSIARFRAIDSQRRMGRDRMVLSTEVLESLEGPITRATVRDSDRWAALEQCLERLQPKAAHIIRMRYSAGTSVKEIAHRLRKTPNAISILLNRSRAALLDCIQNIVRDAG